MMTLRLRFPAGALAVCQTLLLSASAASAAPFAKGPYLQDVTNDAVTVMWEGDSAMVGQVAVVSPRGSVERMLALTTDRFNRVRLDGLMPGRRYDYNVSVGDQLVSGQLTTAPDVAEPFYFVVFGDSQRNNDIHHAVVERVRSEVTDFVVRVGDLVENGGSEDDWQDFFAVERDLLRNNVVYTAMGNHDRRGQASFRQFFPLPANSADAAGYYYSFTYGNSRFIILDSNDYSFALTDQTSWLQRELSGAVADPRIVHRFVVMHHPVFSISLHGGQPELRAMWSPIFERYGVDAVFCGHDHTYQRAERSGVKYFVSGGGGSSLYPRSTTPNPEDAEAVVYFEQTYNYLAISVTGDMVEVAARRDDGTLIETIRWGSPNGRVRPSVHPHRAVAIARGPTTDGSSRESIQNDGAQPESHVDPTIPDNMTQQRGAASTAGGVGSGCCCYSP
ncbi:MAG: metallophosphoesterase, partial [Pseudomonadota bacterium]